MAPSNLATRAERADAARYQLQAEQQSVSGGALRWLWELPTSGTSWFAWAIAQAHNQLARAAIDRFESYAQERIGMSLDELSGLPFFTELVDEIDAVRRILAEGDGGAAVLLDTVDRQRVQALLAELADTEELRREFDVAAYEGAYRAFEERVRDETGIALQDVYFKDPFADVIAQHAAVRSALEDALASGEELSPRLRRQMSELTSQLQNERQMNARFDELHAFVDGLVRDQTPPADLKYVPPDISRYRSVTGEHLSIDNSGDLRGYAEQQGEALVSLPHPYARPQRLDPGAVRIDREYAYYLLYQEAKKHGWHEGTQWTNLQQIIWKESSFNNAAANTSSTASGLFQFLDSTWEVVGHGHVMDGRAHDQFGTLAILDPLVQIEAGLAYIGQARYGSPSAAWSFHERNDYY